ncbi:unnamed protein product [Heligmosomoides polygyrus]|uniref:Reverse transcriptase n=1 Tax=Heligmosomoides polygyrus TaxID=6339 RepID=A0A183F740_HELPZ|nr:unnamed protein product [Heligmosomoides polygyrus]
MQCTKNQVVAIERKRSSCDFSRAVADSNVIDKEGRRPHPDKIQAISEMPPPKDITQLRSLFGMINYYGAFIQGKRQLRALLDALLKKSAPFV